LGKSRKQIAKIEAEQRDVRRARKEFERLNRIKSSVECTGTCLGRKEQRRRYENQRPVGSNERHALADKTRAVAVRAAAAMAGRSGDLAATR
jgi:hypothetical protein